MSSSVTCSSRDGCGYRLAPSSLHGAHTREHQLWWDPRCQHQERSKALFAQIAQLCTFDWSITERQRPVVLVEWLSEAHSLCGVLHTACFCVWQKPLKYSHQTLSARSALLSTVSPWHGELEAHFGSTVETASKTGNEARMPVFTTSVQRGT